MPLPTRAVIPIVALFVSIGFAQDVDSVWQNLLIQAQHAATAHDYAEAEHLFQSALHEAERFGPNDSRVASTLNGLGLAYKDAKRLTDAEAAFRRALAILAAGNAEETQAAADIDFSLASVLTESGKPSSALPLLAKSLSIYEKQTGGQSLKSASVQCAIGDVYRSVKAWSDAEGPLRRCAQIREAERGVLDADVGEAVYSLAIVYEKEGKYALAEPRYRLAEKIRESTQGITSPSFAQALESHAALLKVMGRDQEAAHDAALAAAIRRRKHSATPGR